MELFIFARFYARAGKDGAVEDAIRAVIPPSREEAGCISLRFAQRVMRDFSTFTHVGPMRMLSNFTPVCLIRFNSSSEYNP